LAHNVSDVALIKGADIMASIGLVAIQSWKFPNAFLRMDGSNVTQSEGAGSGTVNCQYYDYKAGQLPIPNIGNDEVFELIPLGELSTGQGFAIHSLNYPQAFLRMDGSNVTQFEGAGSGTVNCQYYSGGAYPQNNSADYEHFIIYKSILAAEPANPDLYSIVWGQNMQVYLRMDGSNATQFEGAGSGAVNCQYYATGGPQSADDYEVFNIIYLTPPISPGS
jgi:uncharacterized protein YodC (DUF2158 family)